MQELQRTRHKVNAARGTLDRHSVHLQRLRASAHDRAALFGGPEISKLANAIKTHASRFRYKPIGPIGAYLTLTDASWGPAVEFAVGHLLQQFLVHSFDDLQTLRQLADHCGVPRHALRAIVTRLDVAPYPVPEAPLGPGVTTVYQVSGVGGVRDG